MPYPRLSFACELDPSGLEKLFLTSSSETRTGEALISDLRDLNAQVCLGILDLSAERAEVVSRLNDAGIPVVAWLLLPKAEGYWFNLDNAPQAVARYRAWKAWSEKHALRWAGVGLDIEPAIHEIESFVIRGVRALPGLFPTMIRRLVGHKRFREARKAYYDLVLEIREDGYLVESYQFPFLADDRAVGSVILQKITGIIDLPVDREVWMLYSSFVKPDGAGYLWSYAPEAQVIGVGSTGGGVELGNGEGTPPLTWDEFARDLRLAWHWTDEIFIFSLEGCVSQGYLGRLRSFLWDQPILFPEEPAERIDRIRDLLRSVLWLGSNFTTIFAAALGTGLGLVALRRWLRRR